MRVRPIVVKLRRPRSILPALVIFASTAIVACSVVETGPTRTQAGLSRMQFTSDARCNSKLGSYALPKTLLRVEVKGTSPDPAQAQTVLTALEEISVADPARIYCLDHLASPTAKDEISVVRGEVPSGSSRAARSSTNLLSFVSSNTIDYTADIVRKIVRTIFIAVSGKADFTPVAPRSLLADSANLVLLANYTFDPFDTADVIRVNRELRPLGYCVLLEIGLVDTVARDGPRFCGNYGTLQRQRARFDAAYKAYEQAVDLPARTSGIFYRPRQPFRVFIYAKDDAKGPGPWNLVQVAHLKLENVSPVVSLGIERAIFSARRTAFLFDRGVLVGWCVSKKSELLAAAEIPLEVVRSIVALPTQIIQVRIDEVSKSNELLQAERDLIQLQRRYIEFLVDPNATKPTSSRQKVNTTAPTLPDPVFNPVFVTSDRDAVADADFNAVCAAPTAANATPGH